MRLYIDSYGGATTSDSVTQTALSVAATPSLLAPLDELAALLAESTAAARSVWDSQRVTRHFFGGTLWDIGDFAANLMQHTVSEAVRTAAQRTSNTSRLAPPTWCLRNPTWSEGPDLYRYQHLHAQYRADVPIL